MRAGRRLHMKRSLLVVAVTAVFSGPVLGQAPAPRPAFDVAGIQVSTRPQPGMRGGVLRGTRYELRNATMVDLIRTAYNVQPERITGGPSWLEWNRFDIAALAPENTPPERVREMLKTLLAERFKLVVREDMVTTTAMALKVKGTHKLRSLGVRAAVSGPGAPEPNGVVATTVTCAGITMAQLAEQLPTRQSRISPGQQVVDETGLSGSLTSRSSSRRGHCSPRPVPTASRFRRPLKSWDSTGAEGHQGSGDRRRYRDRGVHAEPA